MKKLFLIIFVSMLKLLTCEESKVAAKEKLVGQWIWLKSSGGYFGNLITPESSGLNITLTFEEDGTYREFRAGSGIDTVILRSYKIVRKKYNNNDMDFLIFTEPGFIIPEPPELVIEFENTNKLKLTENCFDCYQHTYLRK